ncbi:MAG: hypothetical protein ACERLG_00085 [Sedimentibacter sp.]
MLISNFLDRASDISVKVRTNQRIKRINDEYIGSFSPFGYLKNPKNKNKLIVEDSVTPVIKDIFSIGKVVEVNIFIVFSVAGIENW